jgi:hypothetical protein
MLAYVIGHCCHLQSSPLPSLCNRSSVSAAAGSTVGTDILESRVGGSAIVREFHIHPGNDTLLAVISFSETRKQRG